MFIIGTNEAQEPAHAQGESLIFNLLNRRPHRQ